MKLTDLKLVGHYGKHPSLYNEAHPRESGSRSYFPHVHVGVDECERPRYYRSTYGLQQTSRNRIVVNESGDYVGSDTFFDAMAELIEAAPTMLRLLGEMARSTADLGAVEAPAAFQEAQALYARLMRHEIERREQNQGWGPHFNEDGSPYEETP